MKEEILDLKLKGYCCSQMVMEMGLRRLGKENDDLVEAMAGLCGGIGSEKTCGIITAAWCLIHLAKPEEAEELVTELNDWFEDAYGDMGCADILQGVPVNKVEKCPVILENVMMQVMELLELED